MIKICLILLLITISCAQEESIVFLLDESGSMQGQEDFIINETNTILNNLYETYLKLIFR